MRGKILLSSTLLDGENLNEIKEVCIVINGTKIEEVISRHEWNPKDYTDYEIIDLKDCVVMPGLIDCHNHTSLDARLYNHLEMMGDSEEELMARAVKNMKDDLMAGVTTSRCLGERYYVDVKLRDLIKENQVIGPDLIVSGIGMRGVNGHGYVGMPHGGADQFSKTSIDNIEHGVDFLKIFITSGAPPIDRGEVPSFVSYEEIKAVVEEAKKAGISVGAHCLGGKGLHDCIKAGVDVIEHAYSVSDIDIEALVKSNTWVCMTPGIILDESREPYCPQGFVETVKKTREDVRKTLEKLVRSGVRYTIGTDAYHTMLYKDVEYLVQLGATTQEALKGVTINAAEMCGISHRTGMIKEGYDADIIATTKNPILESRYLSDIRFVMKDGQIYKNTVI